MASAGSFITGTTSIARPGVSATRASPPPQTQFTDLDRARAIARGLNYIYRSSLNRHNFSESGDDYLWCFYTFWAVTHDQQLKQIAYRMGVERAQAWRRLHPRLPRNADTETIAEYLFGSLYAELLGVRDDQLRAELTRAAPRYTARDYHQFDPLTEPPPADVPEDCAYDGASNPRGSKRCHVCHRRLVMRSRYDVWCDALIATYAGEHYGVELGARYADVLKWLPTMHPYRGNEGGTNRDFFYTVYAVTHIVYTLDDYTTYRLSPAFLPEEYRFLESNWHEAIAAHDGEMLGEFMDTLKAFGLTGERPEIRAGINYLLTHQHRDGSWGRRNVPNRYHETWTAIDGLADYNWRAGESLTLSEVKSLLTQLNRESP